MKKMLYLILLTLTIILFLPGCAQSDTDSDAYQETPQTTPTSNYLEVEQAALDFLKESCSLGENMSVAASETKLEVTIQTDFSEENQPNNWDEICANMQNISVELSEYVKEYEVANVVVYLLSSNEEILLTIHNGTESYNINNIPEPTPTLAPNSAPGVVMVWISSSGNHYHNKPSCSQMVNPWQITRDTAWEMGLTACGRCY